MATGDSVVAMTSPAFEWDESTFAAEAIYTGDERLVSVSCSGRGFPNAWSLSIVAAPDAPRRRGELALQHSAVALDSIGKGEVQRLWVTAVFESRDFVRAVRIGDVLVSVREPAQGHETD